MRRLIAAITMTILPLIAHAESSHRELLLRAMKSPSGTASMEINGPMADMIRGQINRPNAKIIADVITVGDLPQAGCKRFAIRFTTPGTLLPTKEGQARMLDVALKLNMCENGMPPGAEEGKGPQQKTESPGDEQKPVKVVSGK